MSKVLIIGNGFDLDLGLKTSYRDFLNSNFFPEEDFKQDPSTLVESVGMSKFLDPIKNRGLNKYIKDKEDIEGWIDVEKEIKNYVLDSVGSLDKKRLKQQYKKLHEAFMSYLEEINYSTVNKISTAARLLKVICDHHSFSILSFNYTDLSKIQNMLNCKQKEYKHVHGSLKDKTIILGCDDDKRIQRSCSCVIKFHSVFYKSTNVREALKNADEIILFGLSLGEIDYHYFKDFFREQCQSGDKFKKKKIRLFTYNEDSFEQVHDELREMNDHRTSLLQDLNDFRILCTHEERFKKEIDDYIMELRTSAKESLYVT